MNLWLVFGLFRVSFGFVWGLLKVGLGVIYLWLAWGLLSIGLCRARFLPSFLNSFLHPKTRKKTKKKRGKTTKKIAPKKKKKKSMFPNSLDASKAHTIATIKWEAFRTLQILGCGPQSSKRVPKRLKIKNKILCLHELSKGFNGGCKQVSLQNGWFCSIALASKLLRLQRDGEQQGKLVTSSWK